MNYIHTITYYNNVACLHKQVILNGRLSEEIASIFASQQQSLQSNYLKMDKMLNVD